MSARNRWTKKSAETMLFMLSIVILAGGAAAQTDIGSCTEISAPGTYVLNRSILNSTAEACIKITSSDVVFDGAGYTVDGIDNPNYYGVYANNPAGVLINVTIKNLIVSDWGYGIHCNNTANGSIKNNSASSNRYYGIYLLDSSNNILTSNNASSNSNGIYLGYSSSNILTNNTATSNTFYAGIWVDYSTNNTLTNNTMTGNSYNFALQGSKDSDFENNIEKSNTVDGKPIFYIINKTDAVYDSSSKAGTLYCIRCSNVTIKDLAFTKNYDGIFFWTTSNSKLENITLSSSFKGISLYYSTNNTLNKNTASSNKYGIFLSSSSSNNTLTINTANLNGYGIYLLDSNSNKLISNYAGSNEFGIQLKSASQNTLIGNTASLNENGIILDSSSSNTILNNTASSNRCGIYLRSATRNIITNNTASKNNEGITLDSSNYNILNDNNCSSNSNYGIHLEDSSNNELAENRMIGNKYNFYLFGKQNWHYNNSIPTSNIVDGQPIIYLVNETDAVYDSSCKAGTLYCIQCDNVTVKGLTLTKNGNGIFLWKTNNSSIENINAISNINGFNLYYSNNNTITNSTATSNEIGIHLYYDRRYHDFGSKLLSYSNNTIYRNSFINNTNYSAIDRGAFYWDNGAIGNHYSSYDEASEGCTDFDGNGICDAPYKIPGGESIDRYPLVKSGQKIAGFEAIIAIAGISAAVYWMLRRNEK